MSGRLQTNQFRAMPQTGNFFIDRLTWVCLFLPAAPVILIFLRKAFYSEPLNLLMIYCLLNGIGGLLLFIPGLAITDGIIISNIFFSAGLVILLLVYRSLFSGKTGNLFSIFLVALFSSLLTFYISKGIDRQRAYLDLFQEGILLIFSVIAVFELISRADQFVLMTPVFWIAMGTIFNFCITLLVTLFDSPPQLSGLASRVDTQILLDIASAIRYLFYVFAGWFYEREKLRNNPDLPG